MSNRDCSFSSLSAATSNPGRSIPSPAYTGPQTPTSSGSGTHSELRVNTLDEAINLQHAELLIHLTSPAASDIVSLGDGVEPYHTTISQALSIGLRSPYLLYQLLAFSARHLAYLHPERAADYTHQATSLQTRAISLFTLQTTPIVVGKANCVPICLFSVVLGHHLLADTLALAAQPTSGALDVFLGQYVQSLSTHRGVFTVAMSGWAYLMSSDLASVLCRSRAFTSREPSGHECHQLRGLVTESPTLDYAERGACLQAIRYLQLGFDALTPGETGENMRYQMLFLWNALVPPKYTALLAAKRPEALLVLSYYTLLLHHGRHIWQVGAAGRYIFAMIEQDMGPEWKAWLEYPRVGFGFGTRAG
ncbi:hypothetical protein BDW74DRAFT_180015 [Aspergillus multicolor]|uniref:uncharacterized protein n=1 Tax=Aspergillus multicolor TaxID=41759 RepID=UPI003CCD0C6B